VHVDVGNVSAIVLTGTATSLDRFEHFHTARNHQGLDNELIVPLDSPPDMNAEIETIERLGGLLRSYRRAA
jgi:hypothetical protein